MNKEFRFCHWPQWLLLVCCLGLLNAQAAPMYQQYQKSPRLAPRDRQQVPSPSPLLASPSDPRIHEGPPPPLDSGYFSVPQALAPETSSPASPVGSHPRSASVGLPAGSVDKPTVTAEPAFKPSAKPVVPSKAAAATQQAQERPMQGKVAVTRSPDLLPSSGAAGSARLSAGEKPLVYFPQDLKNDGPVARAQGLERGFYPVGYTPYLTPAPTSAALDSYQTALLHYNRASYYGHTNQLGLATKEYQQAIRLHPAMADAYVGLSSVYLFRNNWEDVISNADKALKMKSGFMDPVNITQARYNLGTAYCAAADYGKAKRFYKQVKTANHAQAEQLGAYLERNCKP